MSLIAKMALAALLTGVVVGGGTYWYTNNKATNDKAALQATIDGLTASVTSLNKKVADLTPATTPTNTSDPLKDWKTYRNTLLGFSFKYPSDWTTHISSEETVGNSFTADISPTDGKLLYSIGFSHTALNYDNKSLDTQYTYLKTSTDACNTNLKLLASQYGISYSDPGNTGCNKPGLKAEYAEFATGKYIIGFNYSTVNGNQTTDYVAGKAIFDKVVTTFTKL